MPPCEIGVRVTYGYPGFIAAGAGAQDQEGGRFHAVNARGVEVVELDQRGGGRSRPHVDVVPAFGRCLEDSGQGRPQHVEGKAGAERDLDAGGVGEVRSNRAAPMLAKPSQHVLRLAPGPCFSLWERPHPGPPPS